LRKLSCPCLPQWAREWLAGHCGPPSGTVAVHPGSGGKRKCWPAERFAALVKALDAPILLIEGPADRESCHLLRRLLAGPEGPALASGLSVPQAAALLTQCKLYVGNDSGLTHLAGALGIPTVAIFGPTDPAVWAPRGQRVAVVRPACSANERRPWVESSWPSVAAALEAVGHVVSFP